MSLLTLLSQNDHSACERTPIAPLPNSLGVRRDTLRMSDLSEQTLFKQKAEPERFLIFPKADEMIRCKDKFTLGEGSSRGAECCPPESFMGNRS